MAGSDLVKLRLAAWATDTVFAVVALLIEMVTAG